MDNRELYILTSIVFTFFIIQFIVQIISVVFLADQRPSITKLITTVSNLFSFIIVLVLTRITVSGNLILLGSIISAVPVLLFIVVTIVAFNKNYRKIKPSFIDIDFSVSKGLITLGARFFFMQVAFIIIFTTSNIFITQFYGPAEVAVYNIAYKYFQIPIMIFSIFMIPIWSAVTDAYAKSDFLWLRKTLFYTNILSGIFAIGVVFMVFLSNWIYKFWIGNDIVIPFSLTVVFGIYTVLKLIIAPYSNFINGIGKLKLSVIITFFEIALYLILVFIFGKLFDNSTGIVLAIAATGILLWFIQPIQTYKLINQTATGIWNK